MSFLDEVLQQVQRMYLPVTSNHVYMAMKDHESMGILSPSAKRDKIRKALSDLRHKKMVLTAKTDDDGLLWWDLVHPVKNQHIMRSFCEAPERMPEKLPELPKEPCPTLVVHKQLLVDIGNAFLKAASDL